MGQKVHPVGFRVGITKPYQSQWFARFHKYQYSQTIVEDRLLRQILVKFFPTLLNSFFKKLKKREESTTSRNVGKQRTTGVPKITHIKIERGLIPYQIGIQIHAENCELIKAALQNLNISEGIQNRFDLQKSGQTVDMGESQNQKTTCLNIPASAATLAKVRRYLFLLKMKPSLALVQNSQFKNENTLTLNQENFTVVDNTEKNSKQARQTIIRSNTSFQRKLRKRKKIQKSLQSLLMMIKKKASRFSVQDFRSPLNSKNSVNRKTVFSKRTLGAVSESLFIKQLNKKLVSVNTSSRTVSRKKNQILNIFLDKTQKNFLKHLKEQMKYWNERMQKNEIFSLGSNKNWTFTSFENKIAMEQVSERYFKSIKLIRLLEKKSKIKLEQLRSSCIKSGPLSKADTFGYYQIIRFLKLLKEYTNNLQKFNISQSGYKKYKKTGRQDNFSTVQNEMYSGQSRINQFGSNFLWVEKTLQQRLNNIDEESRKMQFIEYLKEIVQKHRKDNIYYYLSTISDSRKNLRKIRQFTKRHATFLFGLTGMNFETNIIRDQIRKGLQQKPCDLFSNKASSELLQSDAGANVAKIATGKDVFLKQIEKQRLINKENSELIPKISLKFYSVPSAVVQMKASVVADTIVDSLEKRQAFRKVIKDAKKELLKNTRVKGVKIQVAGRLNGAEIARTEWVRSGRVPLQTLTANIDYSYKTAKTIYGIIGVKVWIFKGYTKTV
jgi:hypothetical protein